MHALAKMIYFLWFIKPFYKQGNESCAEAVFCIPNVILV